MSSTELLRHPFPIQIAASKSTSASTTLPSLPETTIHTDTEVAERVAKARVVFGSRLAGPTQRQAQIASASPLIAGVLVPPKPDEPDNCCMSGCVNCVWDNYRDEVEEWAAKSKEARQRLKDLAGRMDDDGGGSETNWEGSGIGSKGEEELFKGVPVGIREFMRVEKRLKEQHAREKPSVTSAPHR